MWESVLVCAHHNNTEGHPVFVRIFVGDGTCLHLTCTFGSFACFMVCITSIRDYQKPKYQLPKWERSDCNGISLLSVISGINRVVGGGGATSGVGSDQVGVLHCVCLWMMNLYFFILKLPSVWGIEILLKFLTLFKQENFINWGWRISKSLYLVII